MVEIRLTNTMTRRKEVFEPLDPRNVRMYVCGPTVYDRAHLGNARPVVVFDVLFRLLRHVYGEDHVTYVRNFTDVDDKINARAAETGRPIREITDETIRWFHEDMDALGALRPTQEPRATEWIGAMIAMIEELLARGHAYVAEGHVLFRVRSYAEYGALSGRSVDDMMAGARVEVAPFKEDPLDFVLWKPSGEGTPGWPSPWGRGRPGWHIECSAMARELLGTSFDIHGGGLDLQFPHHENEIAQSMCAHPDEGFARVWMHNEMLLVDGKKMSKSLGNFFTVRDLLDQGVPGEVIRFVLLGTHYGKPIDWTLSRIEDAKRTLRRWATSADPRKVKPDEDVIAALGDDLNTWEATERLNELFASSDSARFTASAKLLGFDLVEIASRPWARPFSLEKPDGSFAEEGIDYHPSIGVIGWGEIDEDVDRSARRLAHRWLRYRRERNFEMADRLRSIAEQKGVELRATRSALGVNGANVHLNGDVAAAELINLIS